MAALAAALFTTPAYSQQPCYPVEQVSTGVLAYYPGSELAATYTGEDAARLTAGMNAMPPRTEHEADVVLVFSSPRATTRLLVFFNRGCFLLRTTAKPEVIDRWLAGPSPASLKV